MYQIHSTCIWWPAFIDSMIQGVLAWCNLFMMDWGCILVNQPLCNPFSMYPTHSACTHSMWPAFHQFSQGWFDVTCLWWIGPAFWWNDHCVTHSTCISPLSDRFSPGLHSFKEACNALHSIDSMIQGVSIWCNLFMMDWGCILVNQP